MEAVSITHPSTAQEASQWSAAMAPNEMVNGSQSNQSSQAPAVNGDGVNGKEKAEVGGVSGIVPTLQ